MIKGMSEKKAAQLRNELVGFVFQSFNLISFKNAMENVALPLYYQGVNRKKRNKIALEYLDKMGLLDWAEHMPNEMSGGQKQRVAIARSLISKPKIIFADEPFTGLDTESVKYLTEMLRDFRSEGGTIVLTTHDVIQGLQCSDRVVVIDQARIISDKQTNEIDSAEFSKDYLSYSRKSG